ncbi:EAL domain-containing protein [Magnetovibrio blakemorei]|uniref:Diguanylate cyclase n=1 Tax=Magnetovibrio blakemorei TaxID=28181 RepID=A0A1E5Q8Q9_9PROT|nr:EAL domain-containing protein [Magnetovibrio blakemorei]OEJ67773.1 hypothetical protein BEN30_08585 [Magnetovibrio blakemorei]
MRLLINILLFSSFITLLLTTAQLYLDYHRDVSAIEQRLNEIREGYADSITASLWNIDKNLLQSQLEGIASLPDIVQATVTETVRDDGNTLIISAGRKDSEVHIWRDIDLFDSSRGQKQHIGILRLGATLSDVYRRLIDKTMIILLSQGLKTFIVSFFILYVVHQLITRHLIKISNFVSHMSLRDKLAPLSLDRTAPRHFDEFDHMIDAFNGMQINLEAAYDQLRQANSTLETRVQERTHSLEDQIVERQAIENSLRESEERFRDVAEAASDWFWELDADLVFTFISVRIFELTQLPHDALIGKTLPYLMDKGYLSINGDNAETLRVLLNEHHPLHAIEGRIQSANGKGFDIQIDGKPLFNADGAFIGYRGAGRDITIRKAAEEAIKRSHKDLELLVEKRTAEVHKLSQAVEQSPVLVTITDTIGTIEYVNSACMKIFGYSCDALIGQNMSILRSGLTRNSTYHDLWQSISSGNEWSGEILNSKKDGSTVWMQVHIAPVKDEDGIISHYIGIEEDISLRKEHEERILHQAQYDDLTNLPNRMLAMDRLNQAIIMSSRNNTQVALMFIDLDDFKKVNDSLGHEVGDALLVEATSRLLNAVREGDTVARQGGDEFLIILAGLHNPNDAEPVIQKILSAFTAPFVISGSDFVISPSIGLSIYPNDGNDAVTLLRNADAAMYKTKEQGGNGYSYFTNSMNEEGLKRLDIERHLLGALGNNELSLAYQPIIDVKTRTIVGTEALIRWNSPTLGFVSPEEFIPIAERTGLIIPIGHWVMETACAQVSDWNKRFNFNLGLAVNVSPRQFRNQHILQTLDVGLATGLAPSLLEIEVTEGLLITNKAPAVTLLNALKERGVNLSMDDFGTGYSSLSYLKTLPFDTLKVDRSFIRDIVDDPDDLALVSAAISMANALGLKVIAEGVETQEQFKILNALNCHQVQGYFFSKPIAAPLFEALLMENKTFGHVQA